MKQICTTLRTIAIHPLPVFTSAVDARVRVRGRSTNIFSNTADLPVIYLICWVPQVIRRHTTSDNFMLVVDDQVQQRQQEVAVLQQQ